MKNNLLIRHIMTTKVICANPSNKLSQVLEFFTLYKIQHLPVMDNDKLVGIISVNDIVHFLHKHLQTEPLNEAYFDTHFGLEDIMTKDPFTLQPNDELEKAISILAEGKFQAIPITFEGALKGIITNKDIVKSFNKVPAEESNFFNIETPGFGV